MASRWYKWCPNKCGKSVCFQGQKEDGKNYECERCNAVFTKEELGLK